MPRAMFSSVSISKYVCSSRWRSWSQRSRRKKRSQLIGLLLGGPQDPIDGAHQLLPPAGLLGQLAPSRRRQPVIPGLAIVFRGAPEGGDPGAILQAMQRGIEGAVFDLKDRIGAVFDDVGDGVAVGGSEDERLKDQKVQSAL